MKRIIFAFLILSGVMLNAQKPGITLVKIGSELIPVADFKANDSDYNGRYRATWLDFRFDDLPAGFAPVAVNALFKLYSDDKLLVKFPFNENLLSRYTALGFARKTNAMKHKFRLYMRNTTIKYRTAMFHVAGSADIVYGKLKCFRIKVSEFGSHLNDLNADGIKFSMKTNPSETRVKVNIDTGNLKYYYIGFDEMPGNLALGRLFGNTDGHTMQFPKNAINGPNLYFNIVYVTDVKTSHVPLNFSVPLKWKAVKVPDSPGTKLVPVKPE